MSETHRRSRLRATDHRVLRRLALALALISGLADRAFGQISNALGEAVRLAPDCPSARDSLRISVDTVRRAAVSGQVTNLDNGQPIANAFVTLDPGSFRAVTDSLGAFRIDGVPDGRYVGRIRSIGFAPYLDTMAVTGRGGLGLHIPLVPSYVDRCPTMRRVLTLPPLRRIPVPEQSNRRRR